MSPATSLGFSAVAFAVTVLGIALLPWQRWLLIHALELRPDGRFRFRTVLILVARQNGKTTLVEVKNLWKMFVLRVPLVIGTAQNLDTSEESWDKAVEICESIPDLNAEVAHVDKTNGKKALKLTNGSRWKIAAASRRGGRGLSGDDVNLDELREHQAWDSWAAVTKTTMARRNPQVYAFSNAGDDKSVVLNDLQKKARAVAEQIVALLERMVVAEAESIARAAAEAGVDTTLGLFEWSAPDDVACTCGRPDDLHLESCRLQDREAWAQANPSLGFTVTEEALASALATDPEPIFRTECLCQRVPDLAGEWQVIREDAWHGRADRAEHPVAALDPVAFAAEVSVDRKYAAIAVAGRRPDGSLLVEVVRHKAGTSWVAAEAVKLQAKWKSCAFVVNDAGPAGSMIAALEASGVVVTKAGARDVGQACGQFFDGVEGDEPNVWHLDQGMLTAAVAGALKRPLGDAWAWDRKGGAVDISPLMAVTLAAWGFATRPVEVEQPFFASYR